MEEPTVKRNWPKAMICRNKKSIMGFIKGRNVRSLGILLGGGGWKEGRKG